MGFLDQKERILDVVLTDKGRELLSKNLLDFTYFAFSDEGVDYSGSLAFTDAASGSLDEHVRRNLTLEADQRRNAGQVTKNRDLNSFLYTVPSRKKVLPEIHSSFDDGDQITLKRRFTNKKLFLRARKKNMLKKPVAVVMRATIPKETKAARVARYVAQQNQSIVNRQVRVGENVSGYSVGEDLVILDQNRVLDKKSGTIINPEKAFSKLNSRSVTDFKRNLDVVIGLDGKRLKFSLRDDNGRSASTDGFLVEVFESGSDGTLKKLGREQIKNPLNDDVVEEGFDSFLELKVDR